MSGRRYKVTVSSCEPSAAGAPGSRGAPVLTAGSAGSARPQIYTLLRSSIMPQISPRLSVLRPLDAGGASVVGRVVKKPRSAAAGFRTPPSSHCAQAKEPHVPTLCTEGRRGAARSARGLKIAEQRVALRSPSPKSPPLRKQSHKLRVLSAKLRGHAEAD